MTDDRLARLQQRFEEQKRKDEERKGSERNFYPFFNIDFGTEAILRFLPDLNKENEDLFMVRNNTHRLLINGKEEKVPCLQNYGKPCPVCEASQAFYKKEGNKSKNGKFYWRKEAYLARVVVVDDPIKPKEGEASFKNKICIINLNGDLYKKIMSAMTSKSDPMPASPDDLKNGSNFIISKQRNGEYASYENSRFARSSSPVNIEIKESDIIDLRDLLRTEPSYDDLYAKLQSSLTGQPYDDGSSGFKSASSNVTNLVNRGSVETPATSLTNTVDDGSSGGSNAKYAEIEAKLAERRKQREQNNANS